MALVDGAIEDAQTGQPLSDLPITARISSFHTQTTTDAQGHFSLRAPHSSQLIISALNYDAQPITPGRALTIKLVPDPSETARRYMNAFMQQNDNRLWNMTHPDAQALWGSEAAFVSFLTRKFGSLPRLSYHIGQAKILAPWIDPDTTGLYNIAAVLPVSLVLGASKGILSSPSEQAAVNCLFNHLAFAEVKSRGLWRVLLAGPLDQDAPILAPAKAMSTSARVPILMYHHVSARPTKNALDFGLTVTTPDFAAQMNYLAKNDYHPITLTDIFDSLYYGLPLPRQPIVISFDDGYEDTYTDAFPILQQHHFVAEMNIITGMIGGRYLTWDQIRQMAAAGMEIGSHTIHHISLASASPQTARTELLDSQATLEQQLSAPIQFFCYPSGEPFHHGSLERQQFITSLLRQDGYIGALLDPGAESVMQKARHPYELPRIRVAGGETLDGFIYLLKIQGVGPIHDGPDAS
jgi:peptidoglycan/xylan/chitin deacetylase (PgdA/CDA1 family)